MPSKAIQNKMEKVEFDQYSKDLQPSGEINHGFVKPA